MGEYGLADIDDADHHHDRYAYLDGPTTVSIAPPSRSLGGLQVAAEILADNPEIGEVDTYVSSDGTVIFSMAANSCAMERTLRYALLVAAIDAEPRIWSGGHPWRAARGVYAGHQVDALCPMTPVEHAELLLVPIEGVA